MTTPTRPTRRAPLPPPLAPLAMRQWRQFYTMGTCHAYTAALTDALGLPYIDVLFDPTVSDDHIIHSCVRVQHGQLYDAGGPVTLAQLRRRYHAPSAVLRTEDDDVAARLYTATPDEWTTALHLAARDPRLPAAIRHAAYARFHLLSAKGFSSHSLADGPPWRPSHPYYQTPESYRAAFASPPTPSSSALTHTTHAR